MADIQVLTKEEAEEILSAKNLTFAKLKTLEGFIQIVKQENIDENWEAISVDEAFNILNEKNLCLISANGYLRIISLETAKNKGYI